MAAYISPLPCLCDRAPAHMRAQSHPFAPVKIKATNKDAN